MKSIRSEFKTRTARGVTLIELMFTVAVAAIIMGLAIPNMMQFARENRLTGAANDMLAAIHIARTEAVKRRLPTAMCFTTTPDATAPACDGTGEEGWISWVDADNDFVVDANENETVLARHTALPNELTVKTFPAGNAAYMGYMGTGFPRVAANDVTGLVICDDRGTAVAVDGGPSAARGLLISTTGRPGVTRDKTVIESAALLNGGACP
jgi:type IV fimbrial biogenesis protein FimT